MNLLGSREFDNLLHFWLDLVESFACLQMGLQSQYTCNSQKSFTTEEDSFSRN